MSKFLYRVSKPFRFIKAGFLGYFWVPCRRCGSGFGGFEWEGPWSDAMETRVNDYEGRCDYCPLCARTRGVDWDLEYKPPFYLYME